MWQQMVVEAITPQETWTLFAWFEVRKLARMLASITDTLLVYPRSLLISLSCREVLDSVTNVVVLLFPPASIFLVART